MTDEPVVTPASPWTPPTGEGIIDCPSCGRRHGRRYVCDARVEMLAAVEEPPTLEPQSDVNVGGPDGRFAGDTPPCTVGTVLLPYYGDEARRQLWRQLDHVRRQHMAQWEPVTITLPRELVQIAANACRARGRRRAEAALRAALDDADG